MKIRYLIACTIAIGNVSSAVIADPGIPARKPTPPALAEAALWGGDPFAPTRVIESNKLPFMPIQRDMTAEYGPVAFRPAAVGKDLPEDTSPLVSRAREIVSGETLDTILANTGLDARARTEVARALGTEYDLRRLRPGYVVTVVSERDGGPRRVELAVEDGIRIEVVFGDQLVARVLEPDAKMMTFARETVIESSIVAALNKAGMPARFAVDLAQMLIGTVDFRRELFGGETLRLLWREARNGDQRIGRPEFIFAALDIGGSVYEIIWPDDCSRWPTIYVDGEILRTFAQPVEGARLSSVFGRRTHPVYGNMRMHTGVDFAADRGTPVHATALGNVSFIGRRRGYGLVVEVTHGANTLTRYAHLSDVPDALEHGQRVMAGDVIGLVGATGTTTGPNLHYEVLVDGRPTEPLSYGQFAEVTMAEGDDLAALSKLSRVRSMLAERLKSELAQTTPGSAAIPSSCSDSGRQPGKT